VEVGGGGGGGHFFGVGRFNCGCEEVGYVGYGGGRGVGLMGWDCGGGEGCGVDGVGLWRWGGLRVEVNGICIPLRSQDKIITKD